MSQRRFSHELQQEQISRKQIEERFVEFGWIPITPLDLGEDFIFHIYIAGRGTGITFHAQAKSITDIAMRRKGEYLVYKSLKPKDLKHWETFSIPVVLIVWDIIQREGRWALISNIIVDLDKNRPRWRNNKTGVSVRIPWNNSLNDQGLIHLKQIIGRHFYPQISNGKELEIDAVFSFPNTPDGNESRQAFERHFYQGEPVTLKGKTIQELRFSDWWQQWFGEYDPENIELNIGSISSQLPMPATINIINNNGETASISQVDFRIIQAGEEYLKLTNHHQAMPLQFTVIIQKQGDFINGNIKISEHGFGISLDETRNILNFLQVISYGGKICVTFNNLENQSLIMDIHPKSEADPDPRLFELVNKLIEIQNKTRQFIRIPDKGILSDDKDSISELYEIITTGTTTVTKTNATIGLNKEILSIMLDNHRQGKSVFLQLTCDESFVELFGEKIQTGPMTRCITGFISMSIPELEKVIAGLNGDQVLSIILERVTLSESFPKWTPKESSTPDETNLLTTG